MSDSRRAILLIHRSNTVPNHVNDRGRAPIFLHNQTQTIAQPELLRRRGSE
jgi:hypothetical protein